MQEVLDNGEKICYVFDLVHRLDFFAMKLAKYKFITEPSPCPPESFKNSSKFGFQREAAMVYLLQSFIGIYFIWSGYKVFFGVVNLLKNILLWVLGISDSQEGFEIDFNTYRLIVSNRSIIEKLSDENISDFSPVRLTLTFLRPMYYPVMLGYFLQVFAGIYNMYSLFFLIEVTQTQLTLTGLGVFFAWLDVYTLSSLSKSTGILSSSIVSIARYVSRDPINH